MDPSSLNPCCSRANCKMKLNKNTLFLGQQFKLGTKLPHYLKDSDSHGEVVVLWLSCVLLFATPKTATHQDSLSFTISWSLLKLMSIESGMPSNHLLCHPLLLLPSVFPSIRVFSNELALCFRWPQYWSFIISPSDEYSGFISFRTDLHLGLIYINLRERNETQKATYCDIPFIWK